MGLEDQRDELMQHLIRLMTEGGDDSFLVASSGDYYVQFVAEPDIHSMNVEAVSNEFLSGGMKLGAPEISRLKALGFKPPNGSPNFSQSCSLPDEEAYMALADFTFKVFKEIYKVKPKDTLEFDLHL
jgi:hypothetical protein